MASPSVGVTGSLWKRVCFLAILEPDPPGKGAIVLVPIDGLFDPLLDRDGRLPVQEFSRLRYVRPGDGHIALCAFVSANDGRLAELPFNDGDELVDRDWVPAATEIEDFIAADLQGANGSFDDIADVGEVPPLVAVPKDFDRISFSDPPDKTKYRHIGPAGGTEDRKVAEHGHIDSVQIVVGIGYQFGRSLGSGVRRNRVIDPHILAEWRLVPGVNRGGGGEDKPADIEPPHQYQKIESALNIGGEVDARILDTFYRISPRRQVEDGIERVVLKQPLQSLEILDVHCSITELSMFVQSLEPVLLEGDIVKVVEVIDTGDPVAQLKQPFSGCRSDKAGSTCDEIVFHGKIESCDVSRSEGLVESAPAA